MQIIKDNLKDLKDLFNTTKSSMLTNINALNTRMVIAENNHNKKLKKLRKDLSAKNESSSDGNFSYSINSKVEAAITLTLHTLQDRVETHEQYLHTNFGGINFFLGKVTTHLGADVDLCSNPYVLIFQAIWIVLIL